MRVRLLRLTLTLCLAAPLTASATPILDVVGGELLGASGVLVGGSLYDVEFLDGTCIALFSGCDEASDFTFQTEADATLAAEALRDQVFLDVGAGNFDSAPSLTAGCDTQLDKEVSCDVLIPFARVDDLVHNSIFSNQVGGDFVSPLGVFGPDIDTLAAPSGVYGVWTPQAQVVPEPATLVLIGSGLVSLGLTRRRRARR